MATGILRGFRSVASRKTTSFFSRKQFSTTRKLFVAGVNDDFYGLTDEQKELRQTVYDFCQKELAPYADQIDKDNGWDNLR